MEKKWYESQGFFVSVILLFGSFWGLSEDTATSLVAAVTGLIGSGAAVFQFFKTSKFRGFTDALLNGNTLQYLVATVAVFLPNAGELFAPLKGVVSAIISKNFGLIVSSLVTLGVVIYNVFLKKK